mgnify:CR=1 FL=1
MILISTLILVEAAPRLQLLAANEEDMATTEITIDNGTDDPDQDVADSVPESEYQECLNKARAVILAVKKAEEGMES